MASKIAWWKTIGAKLGGIAFGLLAIAILLVFGNLSVLSYVKGEAAAMFLTLSNRLGYYQILHYANRLVDAKSEQERQQWREKLDQAAATMEEQFNLMLQGDPATGAPARTDPRLLDNIHELSKHWRTEIRPILERVTSKATREEVGADLDRLDGLVGEQIERTNRGIKLAHQVQAEHFDQLRFALLILGALLLLVIGVMLVIVRGLIRRVRSLARTADRIAVGELTVRTNVGGSDEMSMLGAAFDSMTEKLCGTLEAEQASRGRIETLLTTEQKSRARVENLLGNIREAVSQLTATAAEILASTSQQAAGAQEQAAAISQTVVTVDQVAQTAGQSAQRAREVGDSVQKTLEIGQAGRKAAEDSIAATGTVKERIESTAQDILKLAEQAQAIGEIIATVNDIAEQSNLLALNAALEASRAGEQGKAFAVVASEIRLLADQSKKATAQVRQILGEIQKATNAAVLSTEEVTKGVAAAIQVAGQSRQTIEVLADSLERAAQSAAQIAASAGQQATGMIQINQAMKNIDQVTRQTLAAMRQAEQAAQNLNALGVRLSSLSAE